MYLNFQDFFTDAAQPSFTLENDGQWGFYTKRMQGAPHFTPFLERERISATPAIENASYGVPVSLADLAAESEATEKELWMRNLQELNLNTYNGPIYALDVDLTLTQFHCYSRNTCYDLERIASVPSQIKLTFRPYIQRYENLIKENIRLPFNETQLPFKSQGLTPAEIIQKGIPIFIITDGWYIPLLYQILKVVFAPLFEDKTQRHLLNNIIIVAASGYTIGHLKTNDFAKANCKSPQTKSFRLALALFKYGAHNIQRLYFFDDSITNVMDIQQYLPQQLARIGSITLRADEIHCYQIDGERKDFFILSKPQPSASASLPELHLIPANLKAVPKVEDVIEIYEDIGPSTPTTDSCSRCGRKCKPDARFCSSCGNSLRAAEAAAANEPPVAPRVAAAAEAATTSEVPIVVRRIDNRIILQAKTLNVKNFYITLEKTFSIGRLLYKFKIGEEKGKDCIEFQHQKSLDEVIIKGFCVPGNPKDIYIFIAGQREIACIHIPNIDAPKNQNTAKTCSYDSLIRDMLGRLADTVSITKIVQDNLSLIVRTTNQDINFTTPFAKFLPVKEKK